MPDRAVQEAGDANLAAAVRENARVRNEELVTRLKEKAKTCPFCLEKVVLCMIRHKALDLRGGQHQTIEALIQAAEDLRIISVFDLFVYQNGYIGSRSFGFVASQLFEVGADRPEYVGSGSKCFST